MGHQQGLIGVPGGEDGPVVGLGAGGAGHQESGALLMGDGAHLEAVDEAGLRAPVLKEAAHLLAIECR